MAETRALTACCHCRSIHFTLTLPTFSLPLKVHLCHCTICRTTHGALASCHAPLPVGVEPMFITPSGLEKLTGYTHSNAQSTRYFCSTCGCHIGDHDTIGRWYLSVSLFENGNEGLWEVASHCYTHSTRDGGLSELLPEIDQREIALFNPKTEQRLSSISEPDIREDTLQAQCHCGGVSFTISRPRAEYIASPASNGWVHRSDITKWLALVDVCSDCRLVTGAHAIAWLFVPMDHISPSIQGNLLIGTSKSYSSSEGVLRTFCGTCGATVFYSQASRPGIVDVATGILRAREGVMLGSWAWWRTVRLGYPDDGIKYDEGFTRGLTRGLQEWGKRTHGEVRDLIVGSETKS
ncbi:Mss4-like protein [Aspergillus californicus]